MFLLFWTSGWGVLINPALLIKRVSVSPIVNLCHCHHIDYIQNERECSCDLSGLTSAVFCTFVTLLWGSPFDSWCVCRTHFWMDFCVDVRLLHSDYSVSIRITFEFLWDLIFLRTRDNQVNSKMKLWTESFLGFVEWILSFLFLILKLSCIPAELFPLFIWSFLYKINSFSEQFTRFYNFLIFSCSKSLRTLWLLFSVIFTTCLSFYFDVCIELIEGILADNV